MSLLLAAALLAGFLGGGHCLGMCGPIVLLFETPGVAGARGAGLPRRLIYNLGRGGCYAVLGLAAGAAGIALTRVAGVDGGLRLLRWLAALLVILLGLNLLTDWQSLRVLERLGAPLWRSLRPLTRHVLPVSTPLRALAAGFLWGTLPCGLVYTGVALAAGSGGPLQGAAVMLSFWLGTLPALLLAGASAARLAEWIRRPALRRVAGAVLVASGVAALALPWLMAGTHAGHAS